MLRTLSVYLGIITLVFGHFESGAQEWLHNLTAFQSANNRFPKGVGNRGNATCRTVELSPDSQFWIGTYRSGIVHYNPQKLQTWHFTPDKLGLSGAEVYQITSINNDSIWFTYHNSFTNGFQGLYALNKIDSTEEFSLHLIDTLMLNDSSLLVLEKEPKRLFAKNGVMHVVYDRFILQSQQNGLWKRWDFQREISSGTALTDDQWVFLLTPDSLAIGTFGSIDTTWALQSGLPIGSVAPFAIRAGNTGDFWLYSQRNVAHYTNVNGSWKSAETLVLDNWNLPVNQHLKDVLPDDSNGVWLAISNNGGVWYQNFTSDYHFNMDAFNTRPAMPDEVSVIWRDLNNDVWLGTDNHGIFLYEQSVRINSRQVPDKNPCAIYPNPAMSTIHLHCSKTAQLQMATLISASGQNHDVPFTHDGKNLHLPQLSAGLYQLLLQYPESIESLPIVLE